MGTLCLSRKQGQSLIVGNARITFKNARGNRIRVIIDAPAETKILRGELKPLEAKDAA